jgi:peroxiredoxin Q/BCP
MLRTFLRRLFGSRSAMLTPGSPAPDFDLPDHRGGRTRLADLRGKRVVLWFYPKADTPG